MDNGTSPWMLAWHFLSPLWFRATYPKHIILLIPMCKWFPFDMKIWVTRKHIMSYTYTNGILVGHVSIGLNPCERCAFVASLLQIEKHPKKSQNNGFKIFELLWVDVLPLFWVKNNVFYLDMTWVVVDRKNITPIYFLSWGPSRPLLGIPIIISYIIELQCLKLGF